MSLVITGWPDDRIDPVRELGPSGVAFRRELEWHLGKSPKKAIECLNTFENQLLDRTKYPEFTPWQLRIALMMLEAGRTALPQDGKPGPRKGVCGSPAYRVVSGAVEMVPSILQDKAAESIRQNARMNAICLADNKEWLRTKPRLAGLSREDRIEEIEISIIADARRLAQEKWTIELEQGQGRLGDVGMAVRILKAAEHQLPTRIADALFDDLEKAEYKDGKELPIDRASKSIAVQRSKRRRAY